jgi:hypothetical protein
MQRKIYASIAALSLITSFLGLPFSLATNVATAATQTALSLAVGATISLNCPSSVALSGITGTGYSSLGNLAANNMINCQIVTNNSLGYKLSWTASSTNMTSGSDTIAAYSPASAGVPETWSVAAANSAWGARVATTSSRYSTWLWGAAAANSDTYAGGKWLNVSTSAFDIASSTVSTVGDNEYVIFGSQIGASKVQPTGTYAVNVTFTVTTY